MGVLLLLLLLLPQPHPTPAQACSSRCQAVKDVMRAPRSSGPPTHPPTHTHTHRPALPAAKSRDATKCPSWGCRPGWCAAGGASTPGRGARIKRCVPPPPPPPPTPSCLHVVEAVRGCVAAVSPPDDDEAMAVSAGSSVVHAHRHGRQPPCPLVGGNRVKGAAVGGVACARIGRSFQLRLDRPQRSAHQCMHARAQRAPLPAACQPLTPADAAAQVDATANQRCVGRADIPGQVSAQAPIIIVSVINLT